MEGVSQRRVRTASSCAHPNSRPTKLHPSRAQSKGRCRASATHVQHQAVPAAVVAIPLAPSADRSSRSSSCRHARSLRVAAATRRPQSLATQRPASVWLTATCAVASDASGALACMRMSGQRTRATAITRTTHDAHVVLYPVARCCRDREAPVPCRSARTVRGLGRVNRSDAAHSEVAGDRGGKRLRSRRR